MDRFEQQDFLVNALGLEGALDSIVRALSDDQMEELFDYICTCHEIKPEEYDEDFERSWGPQNKDEEDSKINV